MGDLLLRNATVGWKGKKKKDLFISEGVIQSKKTNNNYKEINLDGKAVMPGFIETHTHLEKALTFNKVGNKSGTLAEAIKNFNEFSKSMTYEDIYNRGKQVLDMAISNGTTALRSHVTVNEIIKLKAFKPLFDLKNDYKEKIDLQLVAFPGAVDKLDKSKIGLLKKAIELGADVVGGCPTLSLNYEDTIDKIFRLAKEYSILIDMHIDESEKPNANALEYLAKKNINEKMGSKVTAGHCTSLSLLDESDVKRIVKKVAVSKINIITLPSCNLFLMGREGNQPGRRGLTRVNSFIENSVNIALASDNIRDPFRPFGNANLLEEALLAAQVLQFGNIDKFIEILKMISYNAAKIFNKKYYGLKLGDKADLVILDAEDPIKALINQTRVLYTIKNGEIVYEY